MFALTHSHKVIETHSTWLACWTAAKERGLVIRWPHSGEQLIPGYFNEALFKMGEQGISVEVSVIDYSDLSKQTPRAMISIEFERKVVELSGKIYG